MDRAYAEPLDVCAVAAVAHVSEALFIRSFRAARGEAAPLHQAATRGALDVPAARDRLQRHRHLFRRRLHHGSSEVDEALKSARDAQRDLAATGAATSRFAGADWESASRRQRVDAEAGRLADLGESLRGGDEGSEGNEFDIN